MISRLRKSEQEDVLSDLSLQGFRHRAKSTASIDGRIGFSALWKRSVTSGKEVPTLDANESLELQKAIHHLGYLWLGLS